MSWAKSCAGAPAHVLDQIAGWPDAVASVDCALGVRELVAAAHQRQVARAIEAIKVVTNGASLVPDGYHVSVSAHGHHTGEDADAFGLRWECYNPVPIAAAGFER